jgi:integrase
MRAIETAVGPSTPIDQINESTVNRVYTHFLNLIGDGRIARETAKTRWGLFRGLVRFAWSMRLIELPRNLDYKSIETPPKAVPTWPIQDVRAALAASSGQLRLHLLLMLNCGMYQKDISDLQDHEVGWTEGTITRKRSKTGHEKNTPVVTYRLWPDTLACLKQYRSGGKTVLLTGDGRPWVRAEPQPDGKIRQSDGIARNYRRLVASHNEKNPKNKLAARPLKELRKTSASLLYGHSDYGRLANHFLGNSPRGIAEKNYLDPRTPGFQELFDRALEWLGIQYGFLPPV